MFKSKFISSVRMALCGAIAMACVSCAHQSKEASLMIDKDTPSEEHVWSDSRGDENSSTVEARSEEAQLEAITQEQEDIAAVAASENSVPSEPLVAQQLDSSESTSAELSNDIGAKSELDNQATNNNVADLTSSPEVATQETVKFDEGTVKKDEPMQETTPISNEVDAEPSRNVSSESTVQDNVNPIAPQTEPTVGTPPRLKNEDKLPAKRESHIKRTSQKSVAKKPKLVVEMNKPIEPSKPSVTMFPEVVVNEVVQPKPENKVNALGEDEENNAQLASVEIATFVQNHWVVILVATLIGVGALYFMVVRKKDEDSQAL